MHSFLYLIGPSIRPTRWWAVTPPCITSHAILAYSCAGDTLCDEKKPIVLERMEFPDPVIKIAIEPKSKADLEKMATGLNKLAQEDPSFGFRCGCGCVLSSVVD